MANIGTAAPAIGEWREFAGLAEAEQRYIERSLDIGLRRRDVPAANTAEAASIRAQCGAYRELSALRRGTPRRAGLKVLEPFMGKLIFVSGFDLAQEQLCTFVAYRFLYERLLGAEVRPWLPSAFCAASALPQIRPERRKGLLRSISEAAATAPSWSTRQPSFFPERVDQSV